MLIALLSAITFGCSRYVSVPEYPMSCKGNDFYALNKDCPRPVLGPIKTKAEAIKTASCLLQSICGARDIKKYIFHAELRENKLWRIWGKPKPKTNIFGFGHDDHGLGYVEIDKDTGLVLFLADRLFCNLELDEKREYRQIQD